MANKTFSQTPTGVQLHAGRRTGGKPVYHSDDHKTYWSGWMPNKITPEELLLICTTTIADLLNNHPELRRTNG